MRRLASLVMVPIFGLVFAGCASSDDTTTSLRIAATSSLTEVFNDIGEQFMLANPDITIAFNFASSSDLALQISQGLPADVFASADVKNMAKVTDAGLLHGQPVAFATNSLEIVVEKGNPLRIDSLAQLASPRLLFVTCPIEVPIGAYTAEVLRNAGVTVTPASLEENVKGILTKVALGEADAGIVYRTDILAAGNSVTGVPINDNVNVTTKYLIGALRDSQNQDASQRFIIFLSSEQGQKILSQFGFGPA
ncbi:MAG: molybdate ABC transporter substrate-binding protein [Actinobacteria bacterium]|nr:molybdate ABC transporter substrate-binding protein [Actinomycetota bacterium]